VATTAKLVALRATRHAWRTKKTPLIEQRNIDSKMRA
jgi:hypothetical protein